MRTPLAPFVCRAGQERAVFRGGQPAQNLLLTGRQADEDPVLAQDLPILRIHQRPTARADDQLLLLGQQLAEQRLGTPEGIFPLLGKDRGDGFAELAGEFGVHVYVATVQAGCHQLAYGALARAHEAGQDDVATRSWPTLYG